MFHVRGLRVAFSPARVSNNRRTLFKRGAETSPRRRRGPIVTEAHLLKVLAFQFAGFYHCSNLDGNTCFHANTKADQAVRDLHVGRRQAAGASGGETAGLRKGGRESCVRRLYGKGGWLHPGIGSLYILSELYVLSNRAEGHCDELDATETYILGKVPSCVPHARMVDGCLPLQFPGQVCLTFNTLVSSSPLCGSLS